MGHIFAPLFQGKLLGRQTFGNNEVLLCQQWHMQRLQSSPAGKSQGNPNAQVSSAAAYILNQQIILTRITMGKYLKESCCCVVKPHRLGDALDRVVGEESEEVEEAGEVGAGQAEWTLLFQYFEFFSGFLFDFSQNTSGNLGWWSETPPVL